MVSLPISLIREAYFTKAQSATKYYLSFLEINQVGTKMNKNGSLPVAFSSWILATYILYPQNGSFFTIWKQICCIYFITGRKRRLPYRTLYFLVFYKVLLSISDILECSNKIFWKGNEDGLRKQHHEFDMSFTCNWHVIITVRAYFVK